jgi:hypothetical protein
MIAAGSLVIALIAISGWLFLNYRALQSHGLSLEQKAAMAVGWIIVIIGLAFVLTRMGY